MPRAVWCVCRRVPRVTATRHVRLRRSFPASQINQTPFRGGHCLPRLRIVRPSGCRDDERAGGERLFESTPAAQSPSGQRVAPHTSTPDSQWAAGALYSRQCVFIYKISTLGIMRCVSNFRTKPLEYVFGGVSNYFIKH